VVREVHDEARARSDEVAGAARARDLEADEDAERGVAEREHRGLATRVEAHEVRGWRSGERGPVLGERHEAALVVAPHPVARDDQMRGVVVRRAAARAETGTRTA